MKTLRAVLMLVALCFVFVFGLTLGVYTSHTNPDFYRQFTLFRSVISGQHLIVEDLDVDVAELPVLSDVVVLADEVDREVGTAVELPQEAVKPLPLSDQMTLTNLRGDRLEVTLLNLDGRVVRIRRASDGREFSVKLETLIESDRVAIELWHQAREPIGAELDEIDLDELFKLFDE